MSAITALVKGLRATGLTQSDIARRTGIPQPRLSRWEAGGAPASADDALKLHQLHLEVGAAGLSSHIATGPQCPSGIDIPAPIRRGISDSELIDVLGGPASVARLLRIDHKAGAVQRVHNWRKRGIPSAVKLEHRDVFLAVAGPPVPGAAAAAPPAAVPGA